MTKASGREVAPGRWLKTCPECAKPFVKGRRATHCEPCRLKLKAWRLKQRREVRRAALGLFPGQRSVMLKLHRMKPTAKTAKRYRYFVCPDCGEDFTAGVRAIRCIACNDRHRRIKAKGYDRTRSSRKNGRRRGNNDARPQGADEAR